MDNSLIRSIQQKTAVLGAVAGILLSQAGAAMANDYGVRSYHYGNSFQAEVLRIKQVTVHEDSMISKSIGGLAGGALGAKAIDGKSTASRVGQVAAAGIGAYVGAQVGDSVANAVNPTKMIEVTMRDRRGGIGVTLIPMESAVNLQNCSIGSTATVVNTNKGPKILGCDLPDMNPQGALGSANPMRHNGVTEDPISQAVQILSRIPGNRM